MHVMVRPSEKSFQNIAESPAGDIVNCGSGGVTRDLLHKKVITLKTAVVWYARDDPRKLKELPTTTIT